MKTEVRGQVSAVRNQESEVRGQKAILDRLTEAEVIEWIAARRKQLEESDKIRCIQLQANSRDTKWTLHGPAGSCVVLCSSLQCALEEIRQSLGPDQATKLREQAEQLLREAEEIEKEAA